MKNENSKEKIIQNLKDADCGEQIIQEFMSAVAQGNKRRAMSLLAGHRQQLLDQFHKSKACIDCLDYLVAKMEKENSEV